ncbi:MAG: cation-translocating P-type ATPase [Patescibacteria group bacterium]
MADKVTSMQWPGLSDADVQKMVALEGYNELPGSRRRSILLIFIDVLREPMLLLLVACGVIYLFLGDRTEALLLVAAIVVVISITLYQERKTERALEALRNLSSPRARVIRNGAVQRIAGREVVRGDILMLEEGDRVPADARLLKVTNIHADESLLTGESVPVRKHAGNRDADEIKPGGRDLTCVYSSTLIVSGRGVAEVVATGIRTEVGKIGLVLRTLETEQSTLQKQTRRMVNIFAIVGVVLCIIVALVYSLTRGDWMGGLLAGLSLAMSALPEEFPVVMTVFLALGAWRISQRNVLTRRIPAVETLGSATVLCVDKTGTITQNRMAVASACLDGKCYPISSEQRSMAEELHELVEYSILASPPDPFDPMEKAMRELGERAFGHHDHIHTDWKQIREYPLTDKLLSMARAWLPPNQKEYIVAAKGAPEAIADLCHLDKAAISRLESHIEQLADMGLRVIAVAKARTASLPAGQHDFTFSIIGLLGLADPIRPAVPSAVSECRKAGIKVKMITGDYPGTARHIAAQIGMESPITILTGQALEKMNKKELAMKVKETDVFARVVPEQKLHIVQALKATGEVVAMTGDGVNDAPALKAANIGVAMGGRGTDVAREAAPVVLLDDNFTSIVAAIRTGRRIYDNLRKAMSFIFAVHIPIAGIALISVLMKWPLALLPLHIAFLELIIDPACTLVFEAEDEEKDVMSRPPRSPNVPLFGRAQVWTSVIQGLGVLVVVVAIYVLALESQWGEGVARALAFSSLVIGNLGLIIANRSQTRSTLDSLKRPNIALRWVIGLAVSVLILALSVPSLRELFSFGALKTWQFALCLTTGLVAAMMAEITKLRFVQRLIGGNVSVESHTSKHG